jgi:hypothetical protein
VNLLAQYNNPNFDQLRLQQDSLADQAVEVLVSQPNLASEINSWLVIPGKLPDYFPEELRLYFEFYLHKEKEFSGGEHRVSFWMFLNLGHLLIKMKPF